MKHVLIISITAFSFLFPVRLNLGLLSLDSVSAVGEVIQLMDLAWSPKGDEIAVASTTGVWLYRIDSLESQPRLFTHQDETARKISYSPDGNLLAAGFYDGSVVLWDLNTSRQLARLKETTHLITLLAFSHDGVMLLAGTAFGSLHFWDVSDPNDIGGENLTGLRDDWILNINKDWTKGVSLPADGMTRIILWHPDDELSKVIELNQFEAHSDIVVDVVFNDAHNLLASFSYYTDDGVRLWDDQTGEQVASIDVWSESIEFSPNGNLLATDAVDHLVKLWSVDKTLEENSLGPGDEQSVFQGHTDDVEIIAFSPNGQYLASASYDWTLRVWNIDTELEEFVISLSDITNFE